jgi:Predicted transcriptional regulator
MIRLSKLTDYASVLLAAMARESKALWSAGELSESTGIPKPTCVKLLKLLVRHGVLNSTQGARGGYSLSRSAKDILVKTIIEAIEGPMASQSAAPMKRCALNRSLHRDGAVAGTCDQLIRFDATTLADCPSTRAPCD